MKALIIAPHVDDETIGCWSVLTSNNDVTVLYLNNELTQERVAEARSAGFHLGFDPVFGSDEAAVALRLYERVYVPSRRDWHADHKRANMQWRQHATHFYSVDMERGTLLPNAADKRKALDLLYPSQASLWNNNDKYWLFEDIQEQDYDVYRKLAWTLPFGGFIEVTVLEKHATWVNTHWRASHEFRKELTKHDINYLLANVTGKVTINLNGVIYEAGNGM